MKQLNAPLPGELTYNKYDNPYNERARDELFTEFGLKRSDASKFKLGLGSGIVSLCGVEKPYRQTGQYNAHEKHCTHYTRLNWKPGKMTFGDAVFAPDRKDRKCGVIRCTYFPPTIAHVVSVIQPRKQSGAWKRFVINSSHGFTQQGIERLNDSIRTYVYAILGAQGNTRTSIVGKSGRRFDAQREFMNLTKTSIESPVDAPSSIIRYQDALQYARSAVNYSCLLYTSPSPRDGLLSRMPSSA